LKALTRHDLLLALDRCSDLTGDREFVVVGSISILGSKPAAPRNLTVSADIDLFPRFGESGEKNELIDKHFGQGSQFELDNNFYIEVVRSRTLCSQGWKKRLVPICSDGGVTGWCLDPVDLAYNKLEAGREQDLQYVGEMLRANILPTMTLRGFLRQHAPDQTVREKLEKSLRMATQTMEQNRERASE
jgi:hypothetical protein